MSSSNIATAAVHETHSVEAAEREHPEKATMELDEARAWLAFQHSSYSLLESKAGQLATVVSLFQCFGSLSIVEVMRTPGLQPGARLTAVILMTVAVGSTLFTLNKLLGIFGFMKVSYPVVGPEQVKYLWQVCQTAVDARRGLAQQYHQAAKRTEDSVTAKLALLKTARSCVVFTVFVDSISIMFASLSLAGAEIPT